VLDFDSGPQPVSVEVNTEDTCGGTLTDYGDGTGNYTFIPTTPQLDTQCAVGLTASDGAGNYAQLIRSLSGSGTVIDNCTFSNNEASYATAPGKLGQLNHHHHQFHLLGHHGRDTDNW